MYQLGKYPGRVSKSAESAEGAMVPKFPDTPACSKHPEQDSTGYLYRFQHSVVCIVTHNGHYAPLQLLLLQGDCLRFPAPGISRSSGTRHNL